MIPAYPGCRWFALALTAALAGCGAVEAPAPPEPPESAAVALPEAQRDGGVPLTVALTGRRSVRSYDTQPVDLEHIAQLLWAAQGITEPERGLRTAPSAGGRFPLEVDVVLTGLDTPEPGLYRYDPASHTLRRRVPGDLRRAIHDAALEQAPILAAPLLVVLHGVPARTAERYGPRASRYVLMEAGHAAQNVLLQATALGLGAVSIGAAEDVALSRALGASAGEEPLYVIAVGHPPTAR